MHRRQQNKKGKQDPEMLQTKKGNRWDDRKKVHLGVDQNSGLIQSIVTTAATVQDRSRVAELLPGNEQVASGNGDDRGIAERPALAGHAATVPVAMRPGKRRALPDNAEEKLQDLIEAAKAHVCAKGEHPCRVIKQQFGCQKTRLRCLAKNRCKIHRLAAVSNLFQARHQWHAAA